MTRWAHSHSPKYIFCMAMSKSHQIYTGVDAGTSDLVSQMMEEALGHNDHLSPNKERSK